MIGSVLVSAFPTGSTVAKPSLTPRSIVIPAMSPSPRKTFGSHPRPTATGDRPQAQENLTEMLPQQHPECLRNRWFPGLRVRQDEGASEEDQDRDRRRGTRER